MRWLGVFTVLCVAVYTISVKSNDILDAVYDDYNTDYNEPDLQMELDSNWPSAQVFRELGSLSSVAITTTNASTVLVLHRADRIWNESTFNEKNEYQYRSLGPISKGVVAELVDGSIQNRYLKNIFHLPHGLTLDHEGNVWITDVAMHQVFKFSPNLDSEPLLTLGEKFVPGKDTKHFCKPTSVAVAKSGEFFVADGYCNSRILKFHPNGTLIETWGQPTDDSSNPSAYQLNIPHQLTLIEEHDLICAADRENYRVVCYSAGLSDNYYDKVGTYRFELAVNPDETGPVYGVAFAPYEQVLLVLTGKAKEDQTSGVQMFDITTQKFLGTIIDEQRDFGLPHAIATCPSSREPGCFVVCSYEDPLSLVSGESSRRLWLYRILDQYSGV